MRVVTRKALAVFVSVVLVVGLMPGFTAWADLENKTEFSQLLDSGLQGEGSAKETDKAEDAGNSEATEKTNIDGSDDLDGGLANTSKVEMLEVNDHATSSAEMDGSLIVTADSGEEIDTPYWLADKDAGVLYGNSGAIMNDALSNLVLYPGEEVTIKVFAGSNTNRRYRVYVRYQPNGSGAMNAYPGSTSGSLYLAANSVGFFTLKNVSSSQKLKPLKSVRSITTTETPNVFNLELDVGYENLRKYILTMNPNNGESTITKSLTEGIVSLSSAYDGTFSNDGYGLVGWSTALDDSGYFYNEDDSFVLRGDTTLHAVWGRTAALVTGAVASSSPESVVFRYFGGTPYYNGAANASAEVALSPNSAAGWSVLGWTTDPTKASADYNPAFTIVGDSSATADVTLESAETKFYASGSGI